MSSQRIRYTNTSDVNVIQSVKFYNHATNGARYKVMLNKQEFSFTVVEDNSSLIAASGRSNSLHRVKKAAKDALAVLGVTFTLETRKERTLKASEPVAQAS